MLGGQCEDGLWCSERTLGMCKSPEPPRTESASYQAHLGRGPRLGVTPLLSHGGHASLILSTFFSAQS